MQETMKEWAMSYAKIGLAVFPLLPNGKRPSTKNGCKDATTDIHQISEWWDKCPNSNIGIATGRISGGLVVIDLDVDEDKGINGYDVLRTWQQENGQFPDSWQSITGRGGYHLFFKDSAANCNRVGLYDGIDIRGDGGYIVAPPSVHPNGRLYEWEQDPEDFELAPVNDVVRKFLSGPAADGCKKQNFSMSEAIPEGKRTSAMISLIGSLKAKGLDETSIRAAVAKENEKKCNPPLTDKELEDTVFPALKRGWEATAHYNNVRDVDKNRQSNSYSLEMVAMDKAEEKTPDWLVLNYLPKNHITSLAGDGGSGKTTVWCAIAAAVSSGRRSFMESFMPEDWGDGEPKKVMFFSSEDSFEYTLKRRLRKNNANLENILSIDVADERFKNIKFNSQFLEQLLAKYRPALCIFDPIQAFVPPDIKMGDRNAMRSCMSPLIGYGEKYGVTFLIVEHANKQSGVWGRKRIADSADIWDISRSVIMAGETNEKGIRYLSHEKSNYGTTGDTILYSIEDEVVSFKSYTSKKDRDFVVEEGYSSRQAPQRDEAKDFIVNFLKDGEKEISELDEMAAAMGISKATMKRSKSELKKDGVVKIWSCGYGQNKKFFITLIGS